MVPSSFTAGQVFQFNLQALLRHLAGAVDQHAPIADVLPAWADLLQNYAAMRSANSIDAGTLLWIARVVFHRIGGFPVGEVAQRVHDSAWTLAGLAP